MATPSNSSVSYSEFRNQLAELINRAMYKRERIVIKRRGKETAALISLQDLALLEELKETRDALVLGEEELRKQKQDLRDKDDADLKSGRKSVEELRRENGYFSKFESSFEYK